MGGEARMPPNGKTNPEKRRDASAVGAPPCVIQRKSGAPQDGRTDEPSMKGQTRSTGEQKLTIIVKITNTVFLF